MLLNKPYTPKAEEAQYPMDKWMSITRTETERKTYSRLDPSREQSSLINSTKTINIYNYKG